MLSVLIPIYNYDCRRLINSLSAQAENLDVEYEILAFDDGSSLFLEENREVKNLPHVVYRELGKNIGRSAIRNLLADEAHYPYLVFMDCDMQVVSDSYLKNYLDQIGNAQVMCGGHIYCRKEDLSRDRFLFFSMKKLPERNALLFPLIFDSRFIPYAQCRNLSLDKSSFRNRIDEK